MIKVWFLLAVIIYQNSDTIAYQGFTAYDEKEKCEEQESIIENYILTVESTVNRKPFVQTYCVEINLPKRNFNKLNNSGLDI